MKYIKTSLKYNVRHINLYYDIKYPTIVDYITLIYCQKHLVDINIIVSITLL